MRATVATVVGMAAAAAGLVTLGCWLNVEAPVALLFGWIVFLYRVVPQIALDGPTLAVSATALVLFTAGVHGFGHRWAAGSGRRWRLRASLALVAAVVVLFAAGVAVIGIAHQTGWLLSFR
ncbi:MAG: hypothetical protein U0736_18620 [Gemmataceae bacterium]